MPSPSAELLQPKSRFGRVTGVFWAPRAEIRQFEKPADSGRRV